MPDAGGLELLAAKLKADPSIGEDGVRGTEHAPGQAAILIEPRCIRPALGILRESGFRFMASVHGVDHYPEQPRLAVHYQLLDMSSRDRLAVKLRLHSDAPHVDSVTEEWPTANHQEREVFDMFGVIFDGHPDLRRILMPEDYEGHPQRRDFPIGGEPVLFTYSQSETLGTPE